jgi:hypothetical protein
MKVFKSPTLLTVSERLQKQSETVTKRSVTVKKGARLETFEKLIEMFKKLKPNFTTHRGSLNSRIKLDFLILMSIINFDLYWQNTVILSFLKRDVILQTLKIYSMKVSDRSPFLTVSEHFMTVP